MSPARIRPTRSAVWLGVVFAIALALIVAVALQARSGFGTPSRDTVAGAADLREHERRDVRDPLTAGPVDAPVTLVVFSDYQCPFCAAFSDDALPALMPYADDGRLRIEWRDAGVYGADSERAARAAYAAGLQGRFWEYHEAMFPAGERLPASELQDGTLIARAADLGLDTARFERDLRSDETAAEVARNEDLARRLGVNGTPTFLLDGRPLVGAQPADFYVENLRSALADAGVDAGDPR